ncbi:MAG: sugar ABC transporter ATP-binding protein [Chloroflexi bacterium]|nr:sugar ABC transporter ATP-binding protein [Chloroflexota bacterium]
MSLGLSTSPPLAASTPRTVTMELRDIHKSFGETQALRGVDLTIRSGEILGIAGPNGAGKSTLLRILAGEETRDSGDILVDGQAWCTGDPRDRVAVVHQEPQLWPAMTVAQNMMVGREPTRFGFPTLPDGDRATLQELDIVQYLDRSLGSCPLAVRQRVEIARALARNGRFFLFDEPNSALTDEESDRLFSSMHELAARGRVVILVTHRLAEMVAHCDRVAVIRDGRVAAELHGAQLTEAAIARELVLGYQSVAEDGTGRRAAPATADADAAAVLSVDGWTATTGEFRDVSMSVRRGEVLALVGVEGSGARELTASTAGYVAASGRIMVDAVEGREAMLRRTAYLPADRRGMLFANLTVGDNLVMRLGIPEIADPTGLMRPARASRVATGLVDRFRVRTQSVHAPLTSLSGGNQQKIAIAAAIGKRPAVLVLEEPTRGVDIVSKAEIYRILVEFARQGNGVLVFCTEVPEVHELADRVLVFEDGHPVRTLDVAGFPDLTSLSDAVAAADHTGVGSPTAAT